jgi:nitric oxide reductase NorQ protein
MQEQVCPECGQRVLNLKLHLERSCPKRDTAAAPGERPAPRVESAPEIAPKVEGNGAELSVPPAEAIFWISRDNFDRLHRIAQRSERGEIINVLVRGPKGCGKTTLAREFAARFGRPFHEIHCGALSDVESWFGKDRLNGGETWYRKARFIHAVETEKAVTLLDEVNRAHPEVLNAILGLLDWRRSMWSDDLGYQVSVSPGVVFFATINEGDDYYGINPLDAAVRDRFPRVVKLDYPPKRDEAKILERLLDKDTALKLAAFAHTLRNATTPLPISTRQLLATAEEMKDGAPLRDAVETAIINGITETSLEKEAYLALQLAEENPFVEEDKEE